MLHSEQNTPVSFDGLGIKERLLSVLKNKGFVTPTPIQHQAIPHALRGEDIIGIAQTGTGKTLAFAIPMLQRLAEMRGTGLVILPTRELAIQVDDEIRKIGSDFGIRTASIIGGASMYRQIQSLRRHPHVIIGTPGRLNDHLEQKTLSLQKTTFLVLDEADRMLDMGFEPQIKKIIAILPKPRQTLLFSATMPVKIAGLARSYMKQPVHIEVAPSGTAAEHIEQEVIMVNKVKKMDALLETLSKETGMALVFTRTKFTAQRLAEKIQKHGISCAEIHSNRSQSQRQNALNGFKTGKYRVLIATDIASRGIDVKNIEVVVNFDLPENPEDYVHRIGRTGRAGKEGKAISFATPDQVSDIRMIERLIRSSIPMKKDKDFEQTSAASEYPRSTKKLSRKQSSFKKSGRFDRGFSFARKHSSKRGRQNSKEKQWTW
ncbi:MAG: DEAD/DEAH box helicase [Parcubacteria group bacterium]|nr:DEAD/DEAH box helicase [Parcubacteria group bacterium]